jgi:hypothetical protein
MLSRAFVLFSMTGLKLLSRFVASTIKVQRPLLFEVATTNGRHLAPWAYVRCEGLARGG